MKISGEDLEQVKVVEFVKQCTDLPIIHIANERKTSFQHGALLKRMGVKAGVSDLFIPRKQGLFGGLWLELKVGKNKPNPNQQKFLQDMTSEGYMAVCVWGSEAAIEFIKTFYCLDDSKYHVF